MALSPPPTPKTPDAQSPQRPFLEKLDTTEPHTHTRRFSLAVETTLLTSGTSPQVVPGQVTRAASAPALNSTPQWSEYSPVSADGFDLPDRTANQPLHAVLMCSAAGEDHKSLPRSSTTQRNHVRRPSTALKFQHPVYMAGDPGAFQV